jgi:glycosyltransferase involved in cell wall biosynthesis
MRRLAIISDAHHYRDGEGRLCTLTPLARQFEKWAEMFEEVIVCAPLLPGPPTAMHGPYRAANISLEPIPVAGGNTLRAKLSLAAKLASWRRALRRVLARTDAVHIRCPNNVSILGLLLLSRSHHLRQAVYTGNWEGYPGEPRTYRWQRWFLRNRFRGPVAVYGEWPGQPAHIVPTFSPVFSRAEWDAEAEQVRARIRRLQGAATLPAPVRLVSVGTLDRNKNHSVAIRAVALLRDAGMHAELDILGEGDQRPSLESLVRELGVGDRVRLRGKQAHDQVREFYRGADFAVQPSLTEGFSKVVVEAMLHGAVPLLSDLPVNRQTVDGGRRGRSFPPGDPQALARHLLELGESPAQVVRMVDESRRYALELTLDAWKEHLQGMLRRHWGTET